MLLTIFIPFLCKIYALKPKKKVYKVNVLVPPDYISLYQQTHASLGSDLMSIALAFETAFNNTTMAKRNGYKVSFLINSQEDNPILEKITPNLCEGSTNYILDLLNDINKLDNTHHYIVMVPCVPSTFAEVFQSVGVDVPIIDYTTNIECAKRVAMFLETNYQQMFSSFSNALLKILNPPSGDYITVTESSVGDEGLKAAITIKDNSISYIL